MPQFRLNTKAQIQTKDLLICCLVQWPLHQRDSDSDSELDSRTRLTLFKRPSIDAGVEQDNDSSDTLKYIY